MDGSSQMPRLSDKEPRKANFVSITLKANSFGAVLVRSVELISSDARVRFSYPGEASIRATFCEEAASAIEDLIAAAMEQPGILSVPDHVVRTPSLVLADSSVIVADMDDGGQQIMVRFRDHYGDILTLFASGTNPREMLVGGAVDHALEAIEQAYLPLFDFANHIAELRDSGALEPGDKTAEALLSIAERIGEMSVSRILAKDLVTGKTQTRSLRKEAIEAKIKSQITLN